MVALAAVACAARSTAAQDLERLQRRADSLAQEWRLARSFSLLQDSLVRVTLPSTMERFDAGALTVVADPSRLPVAAATAAAWRMLDSLYGNAARAVARAPVVVRLADTLGRSRNRDAGLRVTRDIGLADLTRTIARNSAVPRGDKRLLDWLGSALLPGDDAVLAQQNVYVELVTSPLRLVRRCFDGDVDACRDGLALDGLGGAIERWWTAPERRWIVTTRFAEYFVNRPATRALGLECMDRGVDSACVRLLASLEPTTLPRPLSAGACLSLLRAALEHGGRDAYARLLADSLSAVPDRLARASGMSAAALLARWRGTVLGARPNRTALPWWSVLIVATWVGVFGSCALGSSRWRVV
jgi:hypothetical protein